MLSAIILILVSIIAPSYQFSFQKRLSAAASPRVFMTSTAILPSKDTDTLTIRVVNGDELPRCAGFLSKNMYPSTVPKGEERLSGDVLDDARPLSPALLLLTHFSKFHSPAK